MTAIVKLLVSRQGPPGGLTPEDRQRVDHAVEVAGTIEGHIAEATQAAQDAVAARDAAAGAVGQVIPARDAAVDAAGRAAQAEGAAADWASRAEAAPAAVTDVVPPQFFTMADARAAILRVANRFNLDMIDHYTPTKLLLDAGDSAWLADGLHPNEIGHKAMFDRIRAALDAANR
ncbi:SGNH/GDSL hydrolase family protein [Paracoccus suum]|uniref:SGNH/GDSL hydrolase family protein n=1 Tax=Paracoccus suum TaxID=2259340 RepID=A0A344PL23_9RHOB|nr:SGNH/GDSL hydrolase family protein [Paracoccus suum]AXC50078.1 SGNH/GDSL hydrolase family protein [Paracoccus suum]